MAYVAGHSVAIPDPSTEEAEWSGTELVVAHINKSKITNNEYCSQCSVYKIVFRFSVFICADVVYFRSVQKKTISAC